MTTLQIDIKILSSQVAQRRLKSHPITTMYSDHSSAVSNKKRKKKSSHSLTEKSHIPATLISLDYTQKKNETSISFLSERELGLPSAPVCLSLPLAIRGHKSWKRPTPKYGKNSRKKGIKRYWREFPENAKHQFRSQEPFQTSSPRRSTRARAHTKACAG